MRHGSHHTFCFLKALISRPECCFQSASAPRGGAGRSGLHPPPWIEAWILVNGGFLSSESVPRCSGRQQCSLTPGLPWRTWYRGGSVVNHVTLSDAASLPTTAFQTRTVSSYNDHYPTRSGPFLLSQSLITISLRITYPTTNGRKTPENKMAIRNISVS